MKEAERLSEHTKRFLPLSIGDHVRIQNQVGPHPLKWDKTGIVIEVRQFDPYVIRVDGFLVGWFWVSRPFKRVSHHESYIHHIHGGLICMLFSQLLQHVSCFLSW